MKKLEKIIEEKSYIFPKELINEEGCTSSATWSKYQKGHHKYQG